MAYDARRALTHLRKVDPRFSKLVKVHGRPSLSRTRNSFRALVRAVVYQQITGKAAATIFARFVELYPTRGFPTPAVVGNSSVQSLRNVGLSRQKSNYLLELARAFTEKRIVPRRFTAMSNAEISTVLTEVKGIGQWSADMFLMGALNREDVMPVGDYGVQKGVQRFFNMRSLPSRKQMLTRSVPWQPFRSIGSWYMWRVSDNGMP